jgi:hypothetical protein
VKVTGAEADGRLDVAEVALTPGYAGPPPHVPTRIDHLLCSRGRPPRAAWTVGSPAGRWLLRVHPCWHTAHLRYRRRHKRKVPNRKYSSALDEYIGELAAAFSAGTIVNPEVVKRFLVRDEEITSVQRGAGRGCRSWANGTLLPSIRFLLDDGAEVDGSLPLLPGRAEVSDGDVQAR